MKEEEKETASEFRHGGRLDGGGGRSRHRIYRVDAQGRRGGLLLKRCVRG